MDGEELQTRFTYHAPDEDQVLRMGNIRDHLHDLAELVVDFTPASREQALALTHLEQAGFYANAAIARRE